MSHVDQSQKYLNHKFPGQKPGEQIHLLVRKHWIIDVKIGSIFFIFGVVPFIAVVLVTAFWWDGEFTDGFLASVLVVLLYFLFMLLGTYVKWLNEELDLIIVTDHRVVSHDQVDLFHRQISETNLSQVQDVKGVEQGLLGHVFHYGELKIQTAARDILFVIQNVADPYASARHILDLRDHHVETSSSSPVYNI